PPFFGRLPGLRFASSMSVRRLTEPKPRAYAPSPSLDRIQLAKSCAAFGLGALFARVNIHGEPLTDPGISASENISRILKPSFINGRTSSSRQLRQIGCVLRANQSLICLRSRVRTAF